MSPAYSLAVADNLPEAVHVFDRFHVVKLFNEKLSDLPRQVQNTAGMLKKFAKTPELHRPGLLAYYDQPITTGPLAGTNNKIRTMQRQAYGFRDSTFFRLKIFALHETKYALTG